MDLDTVQTQGQVHRSGGRVLLKVIVIAVGLLCGAVLGLIGVFYFGLITIRC